MRAPQLNLFWLLDRSPPVVLRQPAVRWQLSASWREHASADLCLPANASFVQVAWQMADPESEPTISYAVLLQHAAELSGAAKAWNSVGRLTKLRFGLDSLRSPGSDRFRVRGCNGGDGGLAPRELLHGADERLQDASAGLGA